MAISVLVGGLALVVLILMMVTRTGQPRIRRRLASNDPNFIFWGGDGSSGSDSGCDSGSAGDGGCSGGDGGGGGGGD